MFCKFFTQLLQKDLPEILQEQEPLFIRSLLKSLKDRRISIKMFAKSSTNVHRRNVCDLTRDFVKHRVELPTGRSLRFNVIFLVISE